MRRLVMVVAVVLAGCATGPAYSRAIAKVGPESIREQIGEARYVSGHAETDQRYPREVRDHKTRGMLVVTDTALMLLDARGSGSWLTIPLRTIVATGDAVENAGPTVASRVAFGVLATGSRDEMVTIRRELPGTVEVVVFRVDQRGAAPGISAKIDFHARRARGESAP